LIAAIPDNGEAFGVRWLEILLAKVRQERERSHQTRCCTRDGGWPSEAGLQEQALNNHKLRWSKARVVSVMEKERSITSCKDRGDERK